MLLHVSGRVFLFRPVCLMNVRKKMFSTLLDSHLVVWSLLMLYFTCYKLSPVVQGILFYLFSSPQTILQLAALAFYGRTAVGPQLYLFQTLLYCHFLDCNLQLHVSLNTVLLLIQVTRFSTIHQKSIYRGFYAKSALLESNTVEFLEICHVLIKQIT